MHNEEISRAIRQLSLAYCWMIHNVETDRQDKSIMRKFQRKIDTFENFLISSGKTQADLDMINGKAAEFLKKDTKDMSRRQFEIMAMVIFT